MNEELDKLIGAVQTLHEARERARGRCEACGAVYSLAVEQAVSALIYYAEQVAAKELAAA